LPLKLLNDLLDGHRRLSNLITTLGLHFLPGLLVMTLGFGALRRTTGWGGVAIGLWFLASGLSSVLLGVIAQSIGFWRLLHRRAPVMSPREVHPVDLKERRWDEANGDHEYPLPDPWDRRSDEADPPCDPWNQRSDEPAGSQGSPPFDPPF
jgi:hypothetical protein